MLEKRLQTKLIYVLPVRYHVNAKMESGEMKRKDKNMTYEELANGAMEVLKIMNKNARELYSDRDMLNDALEENKKLKEEIKAEQNNVEMNIRLRDIKIEELLEENKKLKEENAYSMGQDNFKIARLEKIIREGQEENLKLKNERMTATRHIAELEEENKELKQELIDTYQRRGRMYAAGEKDFIDNRIKELLWEC